MVGDPLAAHVVETVRTDGGGHVSSLRRSKHALVRYFYAVSAVSAARVHLGLGTTDNGGLVIVPSRSHRVAADDVLGRFRAAALTRYW